MADAEDLVQATLVSAYLALARFDGRHPRGWLLTIVRNNWKTSLRKRRPLLADDPDRRFGHIPAHGPDGCGGAEEHVLIGTVDERVVAALESLPLERRDVVRRSTSTGSATERPRTPRHPRRDGDESAPPSSDAAA